MAMIMMIIVMMETMRSIDVTHQTRITLAASSSISTICATKRHETVIYMELPHRPKAADRGTTNLVTRLSKLFFTSRLFRVSGMAMAL